MSNLHSPSDPFAARWAKAVRVGLVPVLIGGSLSTLAAGPVEINSVLPTHNDERLDSARVIVKFRSNANTLRRHAHGATSARLETLSTVQARSDVLGGRVGLSLLAGRALDEQSHVVTTKGISSKALAALLSQDAEVEYAVVDRRRQRLAVPNDPLYLNGPPIQDNTGGPEIGQWYLRAPQGEIASSINASGAWEITTGNPSVVVAVLDSGVRGEHPELNGRLLPGYDMISNTSTGNDGNGRDMDASDPGDWVTAAESNDAAGFFYQCDVEDSSWHGTKTSSLIGAATNDGVGMAGLAWGVKLLPVRVLGKCGGYDSDIIQGIRWAAGLSVPGVPLNPHPARVINTSLGSTGLCTNAYVDVIAATSKMNNPAVIVAAAGNDAGRAVGTPANCPGVIAVAGLRHVGTKVGFSDLGPQISISAPAGNCVNIEVGQPCLYPIVTATNSGTTTPLASLYSDAFNSGTGTSFSSPLVAGTIGLMLSVNPALKPVEIKALLQQSARPFPPAPPNSDVPTCQAPNDKDQLECYCTESTCGAGMLDVTAAVKSVFDSLHANTRQMPLVQGWNLLGDGTSTAIDLTTTFNNTGQVESIWKWVMPAGRWAFYTPTLQGQQLTDYTTAHGYEPLGLVQGGDGYWVNAKQRFDATLPGGQALGSAAVVARLRPGWNLVSTGEALSPRQFNDQMIKANLLPASTPIALVSLWAWDSVRANWYFFAPDLDAQGGTVLADYAASKGYLDFSTLGMTLEPNRGFWVNIR